MAQPFTFSDPLLRRLFGGSPQAARPAIYDMLDAEAATFGLREATGILNAAVDRAERGLHEMKYRTDSAVARADEQWLSDARARRIGGAAMRIDEALVTSTGELCAMRDMLGASGRAGWNRDRLSQLLSLFHYYGSRWDRPGPDSMQGAVFKIAVGHDMTPGWKTIAHDASLGEALGVLGLAEVGPGPGHLIRRMSDGLGAVALGHHNRPAPPSPQPVMTALEALVASAQRLAQLAPRSSGRGL